MLQQLHRHGQLPFAMLASELCLQPLLQPTHCVIALLCRHDS